jgi:hypothetical protein
VAVARFCFVLPAHQGKLASTATLPAMFALGHVWTARWQELSDASIGPVFLRGDAVCKFGLGRDGDIEKTAKGR